jgi:hypothetical protein
MKTGPCHFCKKSSPRAGGAEDGLDSDIFICAGCIIILRNPTYGPAFLRNHLALERRGTESKRSLNKKIDCFMRAAEEARMSIINRKTSS